MPKEPHDAKNADAKTPAAKGPDDPQKAPPPADLQPPPPADQALPPGLQGNVLKARNTYAAISADLAVR